MSYERKHMLNWRYLLSLLSFYLRFDLSFIKISETLDIVIIINYVLSIIKNKSKGNLFSSLISSHQLFCSGPIFLSHTHTKTRTRTRTLIRSIFFQSFFLKNCQCVIYSNDHFNKYKSGFLFYFLCKSSFYSL